MVRPADERDVDPLVGMVGATEGQHYLRQIWPAWIRDRSGRGVNIVCEQDGALLGGVHAELLDGGEAWAQGLRVAAPARRLGVGSRLIRGLEDALGQVGITVVRGSIDARSPGTAEFFATLGWSRIDGISRRRALGARDGGGEVERLDARRARRLHHDFPALASIAIPSRFGRVYHALTETRLLALAGRGLVRSADGVNAYAILDSDWDVYPGVLWVTALAGTTHGMKTLAQVLRGFAARQGRAVVLDSPDGDDLQEELTRLGFEAAGRDDAFVIIARTLP